ncbi:MAG: dihydroorotate dehydrogenase electron transfer subunit [Nanoarchaeota archaeon]
MHKIFVLKEIRRETPKAVSLIFDGKINYDPGQFIMLWLPGIDEKPFAVSYLDLDGFGVTIEEKGKFTRAISRLKKGAKIGIRGPYGNGFIPVDNSIVVAGGLGMAPVLSLIKTIRNSTIIQGAKSKPFLLYLKNESLLNTIEKNKNKVIYCTDDGSFGLRGFTVDVLEELITNKVDTIYTCGPEPMIQSVFDISEKNKIGCQASLERYMKCGIGICGSCAVDDQLVCKDGPVFRSEQLRKLKELGKFSRTKSGKKVALKEYYG